MTIEALQNYTRLMAPVFSDLDKMPVLTLFQQIFTQGETIVEMDANAVDIDIQRGNKDLSVYIPRGSDAINSGKNLNRDLLEKFSSDSKLFPLIEEITPITSTMISKRMPGESVQIPMSRTMKQTALAMRAHRNHIKKIIRRMELSASESLRTGKQTIQDSLQYDFYRRSSHSFSASTVWSDSANAKPLTDLNTGGNLIFQDGNRAATDVIMGDSAWDEFLNTTQIKDLANSRRIVHFAADMTTGVPAGYESWASAGGVFQGTVKTGNWTLNIWTYPGIYDDAGTSTKYMPTGEVVMLSKGARYDRYFGPMDRLEVDDSTFRNMFGLGDFGGVPENVAASGIFQSDFFHVDAYGGNNNKALNIRTQAAPIFPTIETDTVVKITV